jgi:hypothetical protein
MSHVNTSRWTTYGLGAIEQVIEQWIEQLFNEAISVQKLNYYEAVTTAAQSYPVLLITLYLYINSILKIIRKSCVINLLRYIFI